jgi:hypothetical protein
MDVNTKITEYLTIKLETEEKFEIEHGEVTNVIKLNYLRSVLEFNEKCDFDIEKGISKRRKMSGNSVLWSKIL